MTVDPSIKDQELELLLHSNLQKLEASPLAEGHAVLGQANSAPPEGYDDRLARYLHTVTDINQSDLAAYVSRRRAILDVLQRLVEVDDQGRYSREDAIHSLLMPMRTDFNEVGTDASNLWIIDERLAFHDYLASDKTLKSMPITGSDSTREPDPLATRLVGSPVLAAEGGSLPLPATIASQCRSLPSNTRQPKGSSQRSSATTTFERRKTSTRGPTSTSTHASIATFSVTPGWRSRPPSHCSAFWC
ncbi:hypothetical protein [Streptomyces cyaneofuscatus]|uniref:hypothetical protein n=1 Tax=Streptomyces cyaneofuscatus TaxID=66883 RepID=UPI00332C52F5